jgi:hypothetical protein
MEAGAVGRDEGRGGRRREDRGRGEREGEGGREGGREEGGGGGGTEASGGGQQRGGREHTRIFAPSGLVGRPFLQPHQQRAQSFQISQAVSC